MSQLSTLCVDGKLTPEELQAWFAAFMEPVQRPKIPELVIVSKGTYAHQSSFLNSLGEDKDRGRNWRGHLADGKALACRHSFLKSEETRTKVKEPTFAGAKFGETKLLTLEEISYESPTAAVRREQPIYLVVSEYHVKARKHARKSRNDHLADDPLTESKIKKANTFEVKSAYGRVANFIFADQISAEDRAFLLDLWEKEREVRKALHEAVSKLGDLSRQFNQQIDPTIKEKLKPEEIVKASDLVEAQAKAEEVKVEHKALLKAEDDKAAQIRAELYEIEVKKADQQTRWTVIWVATAGTIQHGPYIETA